MSEMSKSDAELCYKYLSGRAREDVEVEAYARANKEFDQLDALEAAAENSDSPFEWGEITFEFDRRDGNREYLVPITGVPNNEENEIHDIVDDFGWLVVDCIRDEIRRMQESTSLSPREFVALILSAEWGEKNAATIMDISVGNFRGKMGKITDKLETAEQTQSVVARIRDE